MNQSQPAFAPLASIPTTATGFSEFYVHLPEPVVVTADDVALSDHGLSLVETASSYFRIKAVVDRLITVALMAPALPLMLFISLAILLLDGRPIFYRQLRVGKDGCDFWIWKFRTMRRNAEMLTGAVWSNHADARVTPLGRWLRCSHLDELPQFLNILAGDMSLIGPRPERPEFALELARELPDYMKRTSVRPGITGLAQLKLGYDHSVADVRKKLKLDLRYIRTATFSDDVWLLVCTLPYIAKQLFFRWAAGRPAAMPTSGSPCPEPFLQDLVAPPLRHNLVDETKKPIRPRRRVAGNRVAGNQESIVKKTSDIAVTY